MKSDDQSGDRDITDWIPMIRIAPFTGGIATLLSLSSLEFLWSTMTLLLVIQWRIATIYCRLLCPNDLLWLIFKEYIRSVVVNLLISICPMTAIPLADRRIATLLSMQSYDINPMNNQEIDIFIVVTGPMHFNDWDDLDDWKSLSRQEVVTFFFFNSDRLDSYRSIRLEILLRIEGSHHFCLRRHWDIYGPFDRLDHEKTYAEIRDLLIELGQDESRDRSRSSFRWDIKTSDIELTFKESRD